MKRILLLCCLALLAAGCTTAQAVDISFSGELPQEEAALRIVVASDFHYQPDPSAAASALIPQVAYIGEIVEAFVEEVLADPPDALVLCGDVTNNGREREHRLLAKLLSPLTQAGIPVYVVPGNHDLEAVTAAQFREAYRELGYDRAALEDRSSLSYAAELGEGALLVVLDTNTYGETTPQGTEGMLTGETLDWLETVLAAAREKGQTVICAAHHNILNFGTQQYPYPQVSNSGQAIVLLKEYGVSLILSGHRHAYHVSRDVDGEGALYEITLPMLADYPTQYGILRLYPQRGEIYHHPAYVDVNAWAAGSGTEDPVLLHFQEYSGALSQELALGHAASIWNTIDAPDWSEEEIRSFLHSAYLSRRNGTLLEDREALMDSEGYRLWDQYGEESRFYLWYRNVFADAEGYQRQVRISIG